MTEAADGRLERRLGVVDAVVIGLGAMLGAGVFVAPSPAARAAGPWLLAGLGLAAITAYVNATSSARLAAVHPEAGGTYVYAREMIGPYWGFLAGWAFVVGKTASLAAMALTFGAYLSEEFARPLGLGAVVAMTVVNYLGVEKTAGLTRVIVGLIVLTLTAVIAAGVTGGGADLGHLVGDSPEGVMGVLRSAGFLFFAFAGYARLATLGEEVEDPDITIPRAIPIALGIVVVVYAAVLAVALTAVGAETLAASEAPLKAVVDAGRWPELAPVVQIGAAVAAAGVLLSLLAGISRTVLAMARRREMPGILAAVHPRFRTPHRAEVAACVAVGTLVLLVDLRAAIGFSSFAVLTYYTLTNVAAWRLTTVRTHRVLAGVGIGMCLLLALSLPQAAVLGGVALLTAGSVVWLLVRR